MKRFILSSLVVLGALGASAESAITYGICGDEITGFGGGMAGVTYSAAIEVPEAVAKALEGNKVTNVSIGFASGLSKVVNVYLTYDLAGEPFYTQEGRVKTDSYSDQVLETPYVIEGRKFYIGYTYRQSSATGYPIGFDASNIGGTGAFSHLAAWGDGAEPKWINASDQGTLAIRATITGDKELENCLIPVALRLPKSLPVSKEFSYELDVLNFATNAVSSFESTSVFGNETPIIYGEDLAKSIAPGERATLTLNGTCSTESKYLPVAISLPEVNGVENLWGEDSTTAQIICSNLIQPRMVVIEEGTGIDCGYCPAGYVALEQLREKYSKENYVGIAVHNYSSDPMRCESYNGWDSKYVTGYPMATVNRDPNLRGFQPLPSACEAKYREYSTILPLKFVMEAEYTDETHTSAKVATYLALMSTTENLNYGIALVETEDNIGPYLQNNNYSGGAMGPMYGWESEGRRVSTMYNDVARAIHNWTGKDGSVPSNLTGRVAYTYEDEIPLKTEVRKQGDMHLIALLINKTTGEIVTAAKCVPGKITNAAEALGELGEETEDPFEPNNGDPNNGSGVCETVAAPSFNVTAADGVLRVEGEFDSADIFTLDGRRAASLASEGNVVLPAGLYLVSVKAEGQVSTIKIIIK